MSSNNHQCKLLVLDLDTNQITINELRAFFKSYGSIEWIEVFSELNSAIIYFVNYLTVDCLVNCRTCTIGKNRIRLRRFRLDKNNWHIDSHTLYIKFPTLDNSNFKLNQSILRSCFKVYENYINQIDIIHDNQALITFSNYDDVDQILLRPSNMFQINGTLIILERLLENVNKKSRWDQEPTPLTNQPILSVRNPVVHKLIRHIEYLTKQVRDQPNHCRNEIQRLEAEIFILKNENAQLKLKQELSSNKGIEQRLTALEDISNRLVHKQTNSNQRKRSPSIEKQIKRQRKHQNNNNYLNIS